MSPIIEQLMEMGLSENDAVLYEILIKTPDATIPQLQQISPFSRTMLYHILGDLEALELVNNKKTGKKTLYNVEHPQKLEGLIIDQEQEIKRQKQLYQGLLPQLKSQYNLSHNKPGIRYFEGKEGIKEALFDSLGSSEEIYTIVNLEAAAKYIPEINAEYSKKRDNKGISKKILVIDTAFARSFAAKQSKKLVDARFLPQDMNPFKVGVQIYDNKIVYLTLREKGSIAVIIDDPDIYDMHRSIFDFLWQLQKNAKIKGGDEKQITIAHSEEGKGGDTVFEE